MPPKVAGVNQKLVGASLEAEWRCLVKELASPDRDSRDIGNSYVTACLEQMLPTAFCGGRGGKRCVTTKPRIFCDVPLFPMDHGNNNKLPFAW